MKKRLEKKVEKMRRKKVHEILEMVLEINSTYCRCKGKTGNKPTAFFSFSGHTTGIDVSVNKDGWEPCCGSDYSMYGYMDCENLTLESVKHGLEDIMEELRHAGKMRLLRRISGRQRSPLREVPEGYETPDHP